MPNPAPYLPPVTSDVVIDISHYENVSQDFVATAKAGIAAVILKATQGTGFVDPTFLSRAAEARAAGLEVGAYHFLDGSNPAEQAAHFLTVAVSEGMVNWLALDWEPYPRLAGERHASRDGGRERSGRDRKMAGSIYDPQHVVGTQQNALELPAVAGRIWHAANLPAGFHQVAAMAAYRRPGRECRRAGSRYRTL
jgi:hypothetical protein